MIPGTNSVRALVARCADGSLYTGATCDLARRVACHAAGRGARYTRSHQPVTLVHAEPAGDRSAALRREAARRKPDCIHVKSTCLPELLGEGPRALIRDVEAEFKAPVLWSAKTTRKIAATGIVQKLVDLVFDGSAQRLVAHLLESDQISDQERKELRRLIDTELKPDK